MLVDAKAGMIAWAFDRDYLIPVAGIRREIKPVNSPGFYRSDSGRSNFSFEWHRHPSSMRSGIVRR
ncbi:MAG: hypothetical protein OXI87_18580 [Albidovulum sp.]|nr:hypothetical protein [Albidovulum sp.]